MAKNKLPKRIAGFKVPKALRRSKLVRGLLGSELGRHIVADALVAAAGAAATVLVREREEIIEAGEKGARKGKRALGLVTEAADSAAAAALGAVTDAARTMMSEKKPRPRKRSARQGLGH